MKRKIYCNFLFRGEDFEVLRQGSATPDTLLFLCSLRARNGFHIFKYRVWGESKELIIFYDVKLYETQISVFISKVLLEDARSPAKCRPWPLLHSDGTSEWLQQRLCPAKLKVFIYQLALCRKS